MAGIRNREHIPGLHTYQMQPFFEKRRKMKDLMELFHECIDELDSIGIKYGRIVRVEVNTRAKKRYGQCRMVIRSRDWDECRYSINISSCLLEDDLPDDGVKNTIIHEILHSCEGCMNHGERWKQKADYINIKLGYNIKRTSSCEEKGLSREIQVPNYKFMYKCKNCGKTVGRMRKSKFTESYNRYRCGACGGEFEKIR